MSLAIMAAVFPVVFLGELPDKSTLASLVMSTRGKARSVWLGATAAFAVHVAIATTVGVALFRILPRRAVELGAAALFLAGAAFALREARVRRGHRRGRRSGRAPAGQCRDRALHHGGGPGRPGCL